jgi:hypothetical protein
MEKQNENLVHFGVNLIDTIRVSELRYRCCIDQSDAARVFMCIEHTNH